MGDFADELRSALKNHADAILEGKNQEQENSDLLLNVFEKAKNDLAHLKLDIDRTNPPGYIAKLDPNPDGGSIFSILTANGYEVLTLTFFGVSSSHGIYFGVTKSDGSIVFDSRYSTFDINNIHAPSIVVSELKKATLELKNT